MEERIWIRIDVGKTYRKKKMCFSGGYRLLLKIRILHGGLPKE
jgi:hypothetical protein